MTLTKTSGGSNYGAGYNVPIGRLLKPQIHKLCVHYTSSFHMRSLSAESPSTVQYVYRTSLFETHTGGGRDIVP